MKRSVAFILAGVLAVSLAACGTAEQEPEQTGPLTQATAPPEEEETEPVFATGERATEPPDVSQTGSAPGTAPAPQALEDKADILALYNAGVVKSGGLQRVAFSRECVTALFSDVRLLGIHASDDIDTRGDMTEEDIWGVDNRRKAHDLAQLSDAQLQSAALQKREGNLAAYELRLQPATSSSPVPQGYGGYFSLFPLPSVLELLAKYSTEELPIADSTTVRTFNMTGGKLLVVIDLESGRIQSAQGSYAEEVLGDAKKFGFTMNVVLKFNIKAAYGA